MRNDSMVSRYAMPIGILQVNSWSTGPLGFGASQKVKVAILPLILTGIRVGKYRPKNSQSKFLLMCKPCYDSTF